MPAISSGTIIFELGKWIFLSMTSAIFKLNPFRCHLGEWPDGSDKHFFEGGNRKAWWPVLKSQWWSTSQQTISAPLCFKYELSSVQNSGKFIENVARSQLQKAGRKCFIFFHSVFRVRYRTKMALVTPIHERCHILSGISVLILILLDLAVMYFC